jgi:hypothetical protein
VKRGKAIACGISVSVVSHDRENGNDCVLRSSHNPVYALESVTDAHIADHFCHPFSLEMSVEGILVTFGGVLRSWVTEIC